MIGVDLEQFVSSLVATGRYNSKREVLPEGVRLMHDRETRVAALDASITRRLVGADAVELYQPKSSLIGWKRNIVRMAMPINERPSDG